MRIFLDNCVDHRAKALIQGSHDISHARDHGWEGLDNGALLKAIAEADFDVMVTVDKNIRHSELAALARLYS